MKTKIQRARMKQDATEHIQKTAHGFVAFKRRYDPHMNAYNGKDGERPEIVHRQIEALFSIKSSPVYREALCCTGL